MSKEELCQLIRKLSSKSYKAKVLYNSLQSMSESRKKKFFDNLIEKKFSSNSEVCRYLGIY